MFLFYIFIFISTVFILFIFILCSVMIFFIREREKHLAIAIAILQFWGGFYTIFFEFKYRKAGHHRCRFLQFFFAFWRSSSLYKDDSDFQIGNWILVIFAFTFAQHRPSTSNQRQSGSNWRDWRGAGCGRNPAPARSSCSRRRHHQRRVSFFRRR